MPADEPHRKPSASTRESVVAQAQVQAQVQEHVHAANSCKGAPAGILHELRSNASRTPARAGAQACAQARTCQGHGQVCKDPLHAVHGVPREHDHVLATGHQ
jgi:hypothetical protein